MKPFKRKASFGGGGKKFGGNSFARRGPAGRGGGFGGDDFAKPRLFQATCAECGERCEVPFRPNGSKPVLCGRCFKKDGGGRDERGGGFGRPEHGQKRAFVRTAAGAPDTGRLEQRIGVLEAKIDRVLRTLEEMKDEGR